MKYYENLAEMYVGEDVSPDFYGWVFPKYDHVGVGTGSVMDKTGIRKYQTAICDRCGPKIEGGKVIKVEAHPIPEHPRPKRCEGRVALVGDAAGYMTKCSGEGIYFAAKSGRMCGEAIVAGTAQGTRMVGENDIRAYLHKWDKKYWLTYKVLDILQKVFYRSNPAREAFMEMCSSEYVQRMTFDSYLYKTVVPGNPLEDLKLAVSTIGSIVRASDEQEQEGGHHLRVRGPRAEHVHGSRRLSLSGARAPCAGAASTVFFCAPPSLYPYRPPSLQPPTESGSAAAAPPPARAGGARAPRPRFRTSESSVNVFHPYLFVL